jgi:hypothetical protein
MVGLRSISSEAGTRLPDAVGFHVERVDEPSAGLRWIAISRKASGHQDLFETMVSDIVGRLIDSGRESDERLLSILLSRIRAWQEFMLRRDGPLGPEAELGLFGELTVLHQLMSAGLEPPDAIRSWVGPKDGLRDFEIGHGALEVKSTLSVKGFPARVGSLQQLADDERQPLYLAAARFRLDPAGASLGNLIENLRDIVRGEAQAEADFEDLLLAAGYCDLHSDVYLRKYALSAMRLLEVGDGFPRLTPGTVPRGLTAARYEIDVDQIEQDPVPLPLAMKKLGVS